MKDFGFPGRHGHRGDGFGGGRGGGRVFGHGGLRLVLLQLIADKPSHGYELIKAIEERLNGSYSPSPGVIYPTLTLLEELGYVTVSATDGARKLHTITDAGHAHLAENREAVDALLARMGGGAQAQAVLARPPQVVRAIENIKLAIRLRLSRGPLTEAQANVLAHILDTAAQDLERL
jgi:DNA-binding PadR family transcriptional regulator